MERYFLKQNKILFSGSMLMITIKTILSVFVAVLLSVLINNVSEAISTGSVYELKKTLLICVIYAAGLGLTVFGMGVVKAKCLKNVMINLKKDVMSAIMTKKIQEYNQENKGTYIALFNNNINLLEENYFRNFFAIYESVAGIIVAGIVLIMMNPAVAFFSVICMCIPSLIPRFFSKKLSETQTKAALKNAGYNERIKEILEGYEIIKNYGLEEKMNYNYLALLEEAENARYEKDREMAKLYGTANIASVATQFIIMLFAGFLAVKGYIAIGSIVAVTQLSGQVITPAFQLSAKFGLLKSVNKIASDIIGIIEQGEEITDNKPVTEVKAKGHEISFQNVSFAYDTASVLKNVSFKLKKGGKYALTGESGSGKSTILKLLMQYYDSYKGKIIIDDKCLTEYTEFFKECAYVGQEVFLFNDTLENNICLFEEKDKSMLESVIAKTGLEKVAEKLPEGAQTNIGENGGNLSGGERQRIAIARALLHDKKVLLFDEVTSALDVEMARRIEELILGLDDVTCIFVSHKLSESCMNRYDRVFKMECGSIE